MEDVKLIEEIREAVRHYAEGVRKTKDLTSQRALEDSHVTWIFTRIRKARIREAGK